VRVCTYVFKFLSVTTKSDGRYVASRKGCGVDASVFICVCMCINMFLNIRVLLESPTAGTLHRERAGMRMRVCSFVCACVTCVFRLFLRVCSFVRASVYKCI